MVKGSSAKVAPVPGVETATTPATSQPINQSSTSNRQPSPIHAINYQSKLSTQHNEVSTSVIVSEPVLAYSYRFVFALGRTLIEAEAPLVVEDRQPACFRFLLIFSLLSVRLVLRN